MVDRLLSNICSNVKTLGQKTFLLDGRFLRSDKNISWSIIYFFKHIHQAKRINVIWCQLKGFSHFLQYRHAFISLLLINKSVLLCTHHHHHHYPTVSSLWDWIRDSVSLQTESVCVLYLAYPHFKWLYRVIPHRQACWFFWYNGEICLVICWWVNAQMVQK